MEDKNRIPNKGINWFPGHMAQALNSISKVLPTIDAIITIADGRAPISSINTDACVCLKLCIVISVIFNFLQCFAKQSLTVEL